MRRTITILICLTLILHASAQDDSVSISNRNFAPIKTDSMHTLFYARLGASFFSAYTRNLRPVVFALAFTVAPGIKIAQARQMMLTVSAPISLGFSGYKYFVIDLPVVADIHFGRAAGDPNSKFGFIAGGGLGYLSASNPRDGATIAVSGYRVEAGFSLGKVTDSIVPVVMFTYSANTTSSRNAFVGISVQIVKTD